MKNLFALLLWPFLLPIYAEWQCVRDEVNRFPPHAERIEALNGEAIHYLTVHYYDLRPAVQDQAWGLAMAADRSKRVWEKLRSTRHFLAEFEAGSPGYCDEYAPPADANDYLLHLQWARESLDELREMLGDDAYYRGIMP